MIPVVQQMTPSKCILKDEDQLMLNSFRHSHCMVYHRKHLCTIHPVHVPWQKRRQLKIVQNGLERLNVCKHLQS